MLLVWTLGYKKQCCCARSKPSSTRTSQMEMVPQMSSESVDVTEDVQQKIMVDCERQSVETDFSEPSSSQIP